MRWPAWTVFAVMCGWQASAWLFPHEAAGVSVLARMGMGCVLASLFALVGLRRTHLPLWSSAAACAASLFLFGVPAVLLAGASEHVSDTTVALVFAFAPVVAVLLWGSLLAQQEAMGPLIPALLAASGLLLVFPFELPVSARAWWSLAITVVSMLCVIGGGIALRIQGHKQGLSGLAPAALVNAILLLGFCLAREGFSLASWNRSAWLDAVAWGGLFTASLWLARKMNPIPFAARFLIAPLLTIVEGAVLLRPDVTGRLVAGVGLLLVGSGWLIAGKRQPVDEEILSLR